MNQHNNHASQHGRYQDQARGSGFKPHKDAADKDTATRDPTLDQEEVDRFAALATKWWDYDGDFRPLHQLGPARLQFIREEVVARFGRDGDRFRPFEGLDIVDIGCGGGLICEPLTRLGASVTGIDPARESVEAARLHAASQKLEIDYRACRAEDLVAEGKTFDVVLCLEVVEHVPDPGVFFKAIAPLVRSGGILIASTINRTFKSWGLAIVGAEYILRWLPVGTHQWERFITPDELASFVSGAGLERKTTCGLVYDPFSGQWSLGTDTDVNYMMSALTPPTGCAGKPVTAAAR